MVNTPAVEGEATQHVDGTPLAELRTGHRERAPGIERWGGAARVGQKRRFDRTHHSLAWEVTAHGRSQRKAANGPDGCEWNRAAGNTSRSGSALVKLLLLRLNSPSTMRLKGSSATGVRAPASAR